MALPYPTKVVLPFDIATAQDMNERHANDVALANGSGLDDGAVTADKTNFGGNYSTSEVNTGFTWVDGKPIYKKTINFGALPNATTKTVAHGISYAFVIDLRGTAQSSDGSLYPLPALSSSSGGNIAGISLNSGNIQIRATPDLSPYTTTYVTIHYTKP